MRAYRRSSARNSPSREMSRETSSYVSLLLCAAIILNAECASSIPDRCLELAKLDVDQIENYLSELDLTEVPTVKMMTAGFKCPIFALPFGTLKSDWARLLLLQEAQPDGSIVKLKLVRLMRLLIVAYYQMEERIDVTDSEAKVAKKFLVGETTTTTVSTVNRTTSQLHCPSNDSLGAETSSNNASRYCSCTDSFPKGVTRLTTESDRSGIKSNATAIELVTMRSPSSPNGTATVVLSDATRQNVTPPSIDPGATTTAYYPGNARKKAALRILGNCLKQSLKDVVAARRRSNGKVFEIVKGKAKTGESAATRTGNEIDDDRGRDRTAFGIPPNEFWRYVTYPTKAPLAVFKPAYRARGLSGLRAGGPRKSRKRVKLNNGTTTKASGGFTASTRMHKAFKREA